MSKRIYIFLGLLFFAAKPVFGQEGFKFGVLLDPTIVWLKSDVDEVVSENPRLGFNFGMSLDYFFAQNYAFATGVSIFNTGGSLIYANGIDEFLIKGDTVAIAPGSMIKYNIQYVKIPLALKFKTHRIGRMVYSANMGFDLMARTTANGVFEDAGKVSYDKVNVNNEVKLFNMGWHFGGLIAYSLGGDAEIFFGASFLNTFLDITMPSRDMITSRNLVLRFGMFF